MDNDLILGFRFGVFFFAGEPAPNSLDAERTSPNSLDIRFEKVSGLSATITTATRAEGGQNLYTHRLPQRVDYKNLVLERGMVVNSPLNKDFTETLSLFEFRPSNVMVTLFDEKKAPLAAWLFLKAYPVKWSTADLDAKENAVLIDTMELAYTRMQILRV